MCLFRIKSSWLGILSCDLFWLSVLSWDQTPRLITLVFTSWSPSGTRRNDDSFIRYHRWSLRKNFWEVPYFLLLNLKFRLMNNRLWNLTYSRSFWGLRKIINDLKSRVEYNSKVYTLTGCESWRLFGGRLRVDSRRGLW